MENLCDFPLKHEIDVTQIFPTQNKYLGVGKVTRPGTRPDALMVLVLKQILIIIDQSS
jgi:hypothetical protein